MKISLFTITLSCMLLAAATGSRAIAGESAASAPPAVTHVDGTWYAVACLDRYNNKCVVIPVRAAVQNGALKITDITIQ